MTLITSPDDLSQGASNTVTDLVFGTPSGNAVTLTSSGGNLPTLADDMFFEVRDHSQAVNNGLYIVNDASPSNTEVDVEKVVGTNPVAATSESAILMGDSTTPKSIHYDLARRKIHLLEQGNLDEDGVLGDAFYSKPVDDYKSDQYFSDRTPFPIFAVSRFAGQFVWGQNSAGVNTGWDVEDVATYGIRTTQLLRKCGWESYDADGNLRQIWACIQTSGSFEDPDNDTAYYFFGADPARDNTVDMPFAGPLNQAHGGVAVLVYDATILREQATPNGYTFVDGGGGNDSITIPTGAGDPTTLGVRVGGKIVVENANTPANDGSYSVLAVTGSGPWSIEVATGSLTADSDDNTATIAVDNRESFTIRLRVRDADAVGKTYGDATLDAGEALGGFVRAGFPLASAADPKIVVTDATIDGSAPYTGMEIHIYSTPQSFGGGGILVGGPFNFGIRGVCNGGTSQQWHAFAQRAVRKLTDVNSQSGTYVGRMLSSLGAFVGDNYVAGSVDNGATFPTNLLGGGSGVYLEGIAASSKNTTTMYDNSGTPRGFPITNTLRLDFNEIALSDDELTYWLVFDFTIRTTVSDLAITAVSGPNGTFDSSGGNLPASLDNGVGAYVRVGGVIYQVTAMGSQNQWNVTRWDGETISTLGASSRDVDEHPRNSPDALVVNDSLDNPITGTATTDEEFSWDYSNNDQGGRTPGTDAYMWARCQGGGEAQYAESAVTLITSGAITTFVLTSTVERNKVA